MLGSSGERERMRLVRIERVTCDWTALSLFNTHSSLPFHSLVLGIMAPQSIFVPFGMRPSFSDFTTLC